MANIAAVLNAIGAVAKAAAPIVGNGAPEAIALGERVIELIDHANESFAAAPSNVPGIPAGEELRLLNEQRDALEARVNAHVDKTASHLMGDA